MNVPVIVIGAGGHAAVVADALLCAGQPVLGFTDKNVTRHGNTLCGVPVLGDDDILSRHQPDAVLLAMGIGGVGRRKEGHLRRNVQQSLERQGWRFAGIRHPAATISPRASVCQTAQILAGAIVQAGARVGRGCIVSTGAIVEHDVVLDDWTHVAPRSLICGSTRIGEGSHIGAGAIVLQGLQLGPDTVVGAGAVVVRDHAGHGLLIGVPAKAMEHGS